MSGAREWLSSKVCALRARDWVPGSLNIVGSDADYISLVKMKNAWFLWSRHRCLQNSYYIPDIIINSHTKLIILLLVWFEVNNAICFVSSWSDGKGTRCNVG